MSCPRAVSRFSKNLTKWTVSLRRWNSDTSSSKVNSEENKATDADSKVSLPPEPTDCCMTGCPNCVWIKYAQEVTRLCSNGDVLAKNIIMEKIKDPQLRAFVFTRLGLKEA